MNLKPTMFAASFALLAGGSLLHCGNESAAPDPANQGEVGSCSDPLTAMALPGVHMEIDCGNGNGTYNCLMDMSSPAHAGELMFMLIEMDVSASNFSPTFADFTLTAYNQPGNAPLNLNPVKTTVDGKQFLSVNVADLFCGVNQFNASAPNGVKAGPVMYYKDCLAPAGTGGAGGSTH